MEDRPDQNIDSEVAVASDSSHISDSSESISEADRAKALKAGSQPVPVKIVVIGVLIAAFLGIGGAFFDQYIGSQSPTPVTSSTTTTVQSGGGTPAGVLAGPKNAVSSLASQILDLKSIPAKPAPDFTLTTQDGHTWSPSSVRGKMLVLTFYGRDCADICPVVGDEIRRADQMLGAHAADVEFAIVNTNPRTTSIQAQPAALSVPGLDLLPNVVFLNGPLSTINQVWVDYGIKIAVVKSSGQVAHNDAIYLITPKGIEADLAVPFGNESLKGTYSLPTRERTQFAHALAQQVSSLF